MSAVRKDPLQPPLKEQNLMASITDTATKVARKPVTKPSMAQRAGSVARDAGTAIVSVGPLAERRRKAQRRKLIVRAGAIAGGLVAIAAAAITARSGGDSAAT
jgi:hypothetical protein